MLESGRFVLGVNYWASQTAMDMWSKWDAADIEKDFAALAAQGVEVLRVFPRWDDFQPIRLYCSAGAPGGTAKEIRLGDQRLPETPAGQCGMSEEMMERFEIFADLAEKYHLKLVVALLTGHMTFGLFIPRALEGIDLFTHPRALRWEAKFLQYFVARMKHHPAIWAWESGNESNFISQASSRDAAWSWIHYIHSTIRLADQSRPIIGVSGLEIVDGPNRRWLLEDHAELSDILSVHPYGIWGSASYEEFTHIRNLMFCVAKNRVCEDIGGKPSFVEETGLWRPIAVTKKVLGQAVRAMLWNLWANDCRGLLWWCAFDQDRFDMAPYGWNEPGLEHGILTGDREVMPIAQTMKTFRDFIDQLPFGPLPKVRPDAVCIVSDQEVAHGAMILARQAGINLQFCSPTRPFPDAQCYFLPSAKGRAFLNTAQWEALLARVRAGATLYMALDDTYLSHLEDVTGAGVVARRAVNSTLHAVFNDFTVDVPVKVRYDFEVTSAKTLGNDADGMPIFFEAQYGLGRILTLAFPLERTCIERTGLFAGDAWKIYEAIVPKQRLVASSNPMLVITEHPFADGHCACVLVNNSAAPISEAVAVADGWTVQGAYADLDSATFADGVLSLPPNAGIVLELRQKAR